MKINTRYKYRYGSGQNFKNGNFEGIKSSGRFPEIPKTESSGVVIPNFLAVYQINDVAPSFLGKDISENAFMNLFYKLRSESISYGENANPDLIQIGIEEDFPKEFVEEYLSLNGKKPNLERVLILPISKLPRDMSGKDFGKTARYCVEWDRALREKDQDKRKSTLKELVDHLHEQKQRYGLTAFENIIYKTFHANFGSSKITTKLSLEALSDVLMYNLGMAVRK